MFKAVSEGSRDFLRIAIATDCETPAPPCGACRQILWEFCGDIELVLVNLQGRFETACLRDIFPGRLMHRFCRAAAILLLACLGAASRQIGSYAHATS